MIEAIRYEQFQNILRSCCGVQIASDQSQNTVPLILLFLFSFFFITVKFYENDVSEKLDKIQ